MKAKIIFVFFCFISYVLGGCSDNYVVESESGDYWQGKIVIPISENINGWSVDVGFDAEVDSIESALATASGSGKQWILTSRGFDDELTAGTSLELGVIVHFKGPSPNIVYLDFNDGSICNDGGSDTTTSDPNGEDCSQNYVIESEADDHWQGKIMIPISENVNGWTVNVGFDADVDGIDSALAMASGSGKQWTLTSRGSDDELTSGTTLELGIIVNFKAASPKIVDLEFNDDSVCAGGGSDTTTTDPNGEDCNENYVIESESDDQWQGKIMIPISENVNGWTVNVGFDADVDGIDSALATASGSGKQWTLTSRGFDDELTSGTTLELGILVHFKAASPKIVHLDFNDGSVCAGGGSDSTTTTEGNAGDCIQNYEVETQTETQWQGKIVLTVPEDLNGWVLKIHFNTFVDKVDCALATVTGSGSLWTLTSRGWDDELTAGMTLEVPIIVHFSPTPTLPFINNMIINDLLICSTGSAPTTDPIRPTSTTSTTTTTTKSTTTTTKKTTTTDGHHDGECPSLEITNSWDNGLNGRISFTVDHDTDSSWTIYLSWDAKFDQFDCYEGSATSSDGMNYEIDNLAWDGDLSDGDTFTINFLGLFSGGQPKLISATIDQQDICS